MANKTLKKIKYQFKAGAHVKNVTADVVGNELDRIYKTNKKITVDIVVDESRPETAPLHPAFEWDDALAAESFRKYQARDIIKSVVIVTDNNKPEPISQYVHVPTESEPAYHPVSVVTSNMDYYIATLHDLTKQMNALMKTINRLKEQAEEANEDEDRIVKISIAVQAMATAQSAVMALN